MLEMPSSNLQSKPSSNTGSLSAAAWERHIECWKQSEQSKAGYCQSQGLNKDQFYYWNSKLGSKSKAHEQKEGSEGFVALSNRPTGGLSGVKAKIRLSHGIELHCHMDVGTLLVLLKELGDANTIVR